MRPTRDPLTRCVVGGTVGEAEAGSEAASLCELGSCHGGERQLGWS
jgi:hypothetical protein